MVQFEQARVIKYFRPYSTIAKKKGFYLLRNLSTLKDERAAIIFTRDWLWSNLNNFKYMGRSSHFGFIGEDKYRPLKTSELPKELRWTLHK